MKTLDQNIITWAIITPMSKRTYAFKKATKNCKSAVKTQIWKHFPNQEKATSFIEELKAKGTQFASILISDKQFGEMTISFSK